MDKRVLVIIPAYNEEENIVRVVDNLINNYGQLDYVVINDGSRDNTAKLCREHGYNLAYQVSVSDDWKYRNKCYGKGNSLYQNWNRCYRGVL